MIPISSSDKDFNLDETTVYVICYDNSELKFQVTHKNLTHHCRSPCVPRTDVEFTSLAENIRNYNFKEEGDFDGLIRFWTDYVRINETHFWSEIANTWWSQCQRSRLMSQKYSKFRATVVIDGYSKLRNVVTANMGCICVGKVISS